MGRLVNVERPAAIAEEIPAGACRPVLPLGAALRIAEHDKLLAQGRLGLPRVVDEVEQGLDAVCVGHGKNPGRVGRADTVNLREREAFTCV